MLAGAALALSMQLCCAPSALALSNDPLAPQPWSDSMLNTTMPANGLLDWPAFRAHGDSGRLNVTLLAYFDHGMRLL